LFEHAVGDRLHCQFNALRSDEYGTVSGRFSSSQPNLQNIPARDEEWGPLIRGLYIPDEGCPAWKRYDWSQIEYRYLTHYAVGRGAETARAMYRDQPRTDFHIMAAEMVFGDRAVEMRKPTKNINFGLVYGMGEDLLGETLARPMDEVREIIETYHERFPFVRATYNLASRRAKRRGFIRTILKRYARFPQGESTHKALNRLLQGSAADTMKKAMVDVWESGVCDVVGAPHLTVHDELDWSDAGTPEHVEAFEHVRVMMETCIPLHVPLLVSMETGTNWGNAK
jgi:DNA polymerase I-like protein with 3'-5' exonuclease and polymerase domains